MLALTFACFGLTSLMTPPAASSLNEGVIVFSRFDGNIYLFDVAQKRETQITHFDNSEWSPDMQYASAPSFSPDGKQIAFILGERIDDAFVCGEIHIMDVDGSHIRTLSKKAITGLPVSWSPDGKSILYNHECISSGTLASVDMNTGEITLMYLTGLQSPQFAVWSPDGKWIAYVNSSPDTDYGDISIFNPSTDDPPITFRSPGNNYYPSWSPDGKQIVFFGGEETRGNLYIVDVETQKIRQLTHDKGVLNTEPRWSPDGKWIAFYSGNYYGGNMDIIDIEGNNRSLLVKGVEHLSWMPQ